MYIYIYIYVNSEGTNWDSTFVEFYLKNIVVFHLFFHYWLSPPVSQENRHFEKKGTFINSPFPPIRTVFNFWQAPKLEAPGEGDIGKMTKWARVASGESQW